ncbi:WD-repeat protein [Minicystis rosea]|nr:WD-repeat protein [Minicystis rosea]
MGIGARTHPRVMSKPQRTEILGDHIQTIHGLFTTEECDDLVRLAESIGFDAAPITTHRGFVMRPEVRNNTRVMLDDHARALALWERLGTWVPQKRDGGVAIGLNERFRFYRYAPGQYFRWHHDGAFHRATYEQSMVTAMVYLNDTFDGGSTEFHFGDEVERVVPERGMVLLFDHHLLHQGAPVVRGRKYVLRTDVMYRFPQPEAHA